MSKKILLKKRESISPLKFQGYKINYREELNEAQYNAVMHNDGAALVIAGAGTGKTRTLIYRVARLIEDGNDPSSILLLTFTRKSALEMMRRTTELLDTRAEKVQGGTFHSFAMNLLRKYSAEIGYGQNFNVLDQKDAEDVINFIRTSYL
jgi:DNA helicase-2/ATP-dependent DNA helicase PcrA